MREGMLVKFFNIGVEVNIKNKISQFSQFSIKANIIDVK